MNIVKLQVENIKRLSAVSISPDGNIVVIGGKNGHGKTSVLDAIMYALAGSSSIPDQALKEGENNGFSSITLDDMTITRKFIRKDDGVSSKLEIRRRNGDKAATPQALLDSLCGKIAFDPLYFSRLNSKDRLKMLMNFLNLDFSEIDQKYNQLYEKRTLVNKELKYKISSLESENYPKDTPDEPIFVNDLVDKLSSISKNNAKRNDIENKIKDQINYIEYLENEIKSYKNKINDQNIELSNLKRQLDETNPVDVSVSVKIKDDIIAAQSINENVAAKKRSATLKTQIDKLTIESENITKDLDKIYLEKLTLIKSANFPINGISIKDDKMIYNGIEFDQLSSAEKLKISTAMGIAFNPTLKVMLIKDGSLLDEESLADISQMADESGTQIWIERVGDGQECSIIITDGHVKE